MHSFTVKKVSFSQFFLKSAIAAQKSDKAIDGIPSLWYNLILYYFQADFSAFGDQNNEKELHSQGIRARA